MLMYPSIFKFFQDLTETQVINKKFTLYFKITAKRNLTKSHDVRLKCSKYKTHVIKEVFFKKLNYNQMNQFYGLSNDEKLFLGYQKVPKK